MACPEVLELILANEKIIIIENKNKDKKIAMLQTMESAEIRNMNEKEVLDSNEV